MAVKKEGIIMNESRRNLHYSDYEDKIILMMYNNGNSAAEIAITLGNGRTEGGVQHRIFLILKSFSKVLIIKINIYIPSISNFIIIYSSGN